MSLSGEVVLKASVEIDEKLSRRIRRLASLCRQPIDGFIREAVEQHAKRLEARERFFAEADASWDAYQKNGLHLTDDEVGAWLKSVGTDEEMPLPECHD